MKINTLALYNFLSLCRKAHKGQRLLSIGFKVIDGSLCATAIDRTIAVFCKDLSHSEDKSFEFFVLFKDLFEVVKSAKSSKVEYLELGVSERHDTFGVTTLPITADLSWRHEPTEDFTYILDSEHSAMLGLAAKTVSFLVDENSPRNYGSAAYLDKGHLVATDGFRLVRAPTTEVPEGLVGICLAPRHLAAIASLATSGSLQLSLPEDRTTLGVRQGCTSIYMRLPNIQYPKYQGVLPKTTRSVRFDRKAAIAAIKSVLPNADKSKAMVLTFNSETVKMHCKDIDRNTEASTELNYSDAWGSSIEVALNGEFLLDALNSTKDNSIELLFVGESETTPEEQPVSILSSNSHNVIVPIRKN